MSVKKTAKTAGADERTPSHSQYFSWINNTNEGSTEKQTLINLDYFKWLRDEFGMSLDIYAWDAGNLDGSRETYQTPDSPKIRAQFPEGYAPIAAKSSEMNTRLGVWCGPDGFGKTPEDAQRRAEMMVSLCRDFNFALFKIDGVCGQLRRTKRKYFIEMMKECRKYQPDLVLLNHRLELGSAMPYATTFLWEGVETYIDVHVANRCTAPHHRAYLFGRNLVPGLERLAEDHGVCISSCPDCFEDDLIYQAFNRCLILAPEIYGNPWLLRDEEQARLAHIFNLHRRYRDILVDAVVIPEEYSQSCTSRGDGLTQFVTLGNCSWENKKIRLRLNEEIGLKNCARIAVTLRHPYEQRLGVFAFGDSVEIELPAFRAVLVEVCEESRAERSLTNCAYEVMREDDTGARRVKIVKAWGKIEPIGSGKAESIMSELSTPFDFTARSPLKLGSAKDCPIPANARRLIETTLFAADNDSLEARMLKRAGETKIPQVAAAREEFFAQERYALRGCEGRFAFDGKADTFFDGSSKKAYGGMRIDGGCLRVDFGETIHADSVMLEYFSPYEEFDEFELQTLTLAGAFGTQTECPFVAPLERESVVQSEAVIKVIKNSVHNLFEVKGERKRVYYAIGGDVRYFRLPCPVDRIFKIAPMSGEKEITLSSPTVSNLFASCDSPPVGARQATVRIDKERAREGSFIAVALEGEHGREGAYVCAEANGRLYGFPDRASSYPSNAWECPVRDVKKYYTYYLPMTDSLYDTDITITVLSLNAEKNDFSVDIYFCDSVDATGGQIVDF